jgi:hypothetical protein
MWSLGKSGSDHDHSVTVKIIWQTFQTHLAILKCFATMNSLKGATKAGQDQEKDIVPLREACAFIRLH